MPLVTFGACPYGRMAPKGHMGHVYYSPVPHATTTNLSRVYNKSKCTNSESGTQSQLSLIPIALLVTPFPLVT